MDWRLPANLLPDSEKNVISKIMTYQTKHMRQFQYFIQIYNSIIFIHSTLRREKYGSEK